MAVGRAIGEGIVPAVEQPAGELERELAWRESVIEQGVVEIAASAAGIVHVPSDQTQIEWLLTRSRLSRVEATAYAAWLAERAVMLVHSARFWTPCGALAEELLERETLTGAACRRVIREALTVPGFETRS